MIGLRRWWDLKSGIPGEGRTDEYEGVLEEYPGVLKGGWDGGVPP